jgi:hypothetical protein
MSLKSLAEILKPPVHPREPPSAMDWQSFEKDQHLVLPEDYKDLISQYGTGNIDHFLAILSPFAKNDNLNLLRHGKIIHDAYRELSSHHPDFHPDPVFPDPDGLMVCGVTDNGDFLFWKTKSEPDTWTIVVAGSQALRPRRYNMNLTDFLFQLLTKQITCSVFPDDFPTDAPTFT